MEYEVTEMGCWILAGAEDPGGTRTSRPARRLFRLLRAPIPPGVVIVHACGTPGCLNPEHLGPCTPAEVAQRSSSAKLTPVDVLTIRRLRAAGVPRRRVAQLFGVDPSAISHITSRRRWANVY